MTLRTYCWLALAFALGTGTTESAPVPPAEAWVFVQTEKGKWAIRVDGGAPKQVEAEPPVRPNDPKLVHLPDVKPVGVHAWEIENGKRVLYHEDVPETRGPGKKFEGWRSRLIVADAKGQNPKALITGLPRISEYTVTADGKAVVCVAEKGGKWGVYRVPFDGAEPTRLSRTDSTGPLGFQLLKDGRVAYFAVTGEHVEPLAIRGQVVGTTSTSVGTVVLTDGKTEKVLIKETRAGLPEFTADGSKMATVGTTDKGATVVVVTDLKTDKAEEFPVSAFHRGWKCQFGRLRFRPDGNALLVTFSLGSVVVRDNGPLPGDEAVQHFGVIWLGGRKPRTALFEIEQPRKENGHFPDIQWFEWTGRPAPKD
ncbi:TolB family protein [Frigoriglobus tundricola]|uniref:Uncharacterized protein n=1 Tax=Frigoriglobus tundricola TaxID=2774151 RepID=A0A6M5YKY6_9BACT|nr:hypothetical protein [Frigoriglobus tundricola]QJW93662.1 hypothetical protein FTUN_1170 [Frigoriglobus tundricola]